MKSYARYQKKNSHVDPFKGHAKIEDGMPDLGSLELHNRSKYGVKKPANVWGHEMDDNRICGFQIRTANFKTSMFEKDRASQKKSPWVDAKQKLWKSSFDDEFTKIIIRIFFSKILKHNWF